MTARTTVRTALGVLWGTLFAVYVAAKINFFTHYDPLRVGSYIRHHSIYLLGMAGSAFLIWLIEKRFPQGRL
jgi:hypothetical protein